MAQVQITPIRRTGADHSSQTRDPFSQCTKGQLTTGRQAPNLDRETILDQRSHQPLDIQARKNRIPQGNINQGGGAPIQQGQTQKSAPKPDA